MKDYNFNLDAILKSKQRAKWYQEAQKTLFKLPYSVRFRSSYNLASGFAVFYHGISVILGLITALLLASISSGIGSGVGALDRLKEVDALILFLFGAFMLILIITLVGIEKLKADVVKTIFVDKANDKEILKRNLAGLFLLMLVSIGISGIGGAVLTSTMSDETAMIEAAYTAQKDSTSAHFNKLIAAVDSTKKAYFTQNQWGGRLDNSSRPQYNLYAQKSLELENKKQAELKFLKNDLNTAKQQASLSSQKYGVIAGLFIMVFELLTLLAYSFKFEYLKKVRIEAELLKQQDETNQDAEHWKVYVRKPDADYDEQKIGFQMQQTKKTDSVSKNDVPNGFPITCENCGKHAVMKKENAKYCSDKCRGLAYRKSKDKS